MPPRHHLPRDWPHAGARDPRGGGGGACGGCRRRPRHHGPARRHARGAQGSDGDDPGDGGGGFRGEGRGGCVQNRNHDRDSPRRVDVRSDRDRGGVLLLRNQRPDADDLWVLARRRCQVSAHVPGAGDPTARSLSGAGPGGRGAAHRDVGEAGSRDEAGAQGGHLRGARRRSILRRILSPQGSRLRVLLAVPRANRPTGGGAGGAQQRRVNDESIHFLIQTYTIQTYTPPPTYPPVRIASVPSVIQWSFVNPPRREA